MIPVCLLNMSILQCQHGSVLGFSLFFFSFFSLLIDTLTHSKGAHTLALPLTVAWLSDINVYVN